MSQYVQNIQAKLNDYQPLTEITGTQQDNVLKLLEHPGFEALMGLMLAEQQGLFRRLQNIRPGTPANDAELAVTQGLTKAIDRIGEILVEIAESNDPQAEGESK